MDFKKVFLIFAFVGILLLLIGFTLPIIAEGSGCLLLGDFYGPIDNEYYLISTITEFGIEAFKIFGIGMCIYGAFGSIFNKTIKKHCHIKTTVTAMYISIDIGFALFSLFMFVFGCHFFTEPKNHPIRYPASISFMIVSFLMFCGLIYIYIRFRKEQKSIVGVLIDVGTAIVFAGGFFLNFYMLYSVVSDVFHYYDILPEEMAKEIINAGLFILPIAVIFIVVPTVIFLDTKR